MQNNSKKKQIAIISTKIKTKTKDSKILFLFIVSTIQSKQLLQHITFEF